MLQPELSGEFATLMGWADQSRRLKIRTNAETPLDARTAVKFGAEGIGLCRPNTCSSMVIALSRCGK